MSEPEKIPMPGSLQEIVGALLFASETPLTATDLKNAIRAMPPEEGDGREAAEIYRTCTSREIDAALKGLEKALEVAGCGFSLECAGGAYRLQTVPPCGRYVRAMLKLDRPGRLGRATLETLAIVAYRQPVTKSEIEEIRGVDVGGNIKTLMDLELVRLVGKSELPGHPFLYGTTPEFLEHFGISSLGSLDGFDPTLQRSDPRAKAESYKRPAAETEDGQEELPLDKDEESGASEEAEKLPDVEEDEKTSGVSEEAEKSEDDVEDEFDEEDEFDDEDEEEEEDDEGLDDEDE